MDKETYTDNRVVVLSKDFIFAKVNTKEDSLTKKQFNIFGTPTVIVARSSGEEIDRIVGFHSPAEFLTKVKDYKKGKNTLADLENKLNKNPENIDLLYTIGDKQQWRGNYERAIELYNQILSLDPENKKLKSDSAAFNLAFIIYRQKDYLGAVPEFEKFKATYPNSGLVTDADIYIPVCYQKAEEKAKALEYFQKYIELHPKGEDVDYAKEQIEKIQQELAEAE